MKEEITKIAKEFQPIYEKNGWTWASGKPTVESIAKLIEEQIRIMKYHDDEEHTSVSSGRIRVEQLNSGVYEVTLEANTGYVTAPTT